MIMVPGNVTVIEVFVSIDVSTEMVLLSAVIISCWDAMMIALPSIMCCIAAISASCCMLCASRAWTVA